MPQATERYHSLDFLRATAMFLGILLHAVLSFVNLPMPFWPARDDERSQVADLFVFVVHAFRMQTFFLLAGFFGCLLYERYGLAGMLKHRFVRIVIPLGLGVLVVGPTLQAIWFFGEPAALRYLIPGFDASRSVGDSLADLFGTGRFLTNLPLAHLWFLYHLIIFFVLMLPLLGLAQAAGQTQLGQFCVSGFRRLLRMPGKALVLAIPTALVTLPMRVWGFVDTPESWTPSAAIVAYYFFFFVVGWMLWGQRDLLPAFMRRWQGSLAIANLLVLPATMKLFFDVIDGLQGKAPLPGFGYQLAICYLSGLYTWLMIGGLMGAFHYFFGRERRWVRYFADASYWCYLWHLTPIVILQLALAHVALPGLVKFVLIIGVSMTILLATYEWCVRYTLIGAILNGRKVRKPEAVVSVYPESSGIRQNSADSIRNSGEFRYSRDRL